MKIENAEKEEFFAKFRKCSPFFIALGDENRQKLLNEIIDSGENGINVMTLASRHQLSRPAISHHLKILKDANIVSTMKTGTQVFYKIDINDNFNEILDLIETVKALINKARQPEVNITLG